jgi:hypothetical protein
MMAKRNKAEAIPYVNLDSFYLEHRLCRELQENTTPNRVKLWSSGGASITVNLPPLHGQRPS